MSSSRKTQQAIESGKSNAVGAHLVKNWCAHIRIERMGAGGLLEQMTGLPIGHQGVGCDHAPRGGMMSWEIRDAALGFYDRNCVRCAFRKPVNIPNLGQWVSERNKARAEGEATEARRVEARTAAHNTRQQVRTELRTGQTPAAADVLHQIDELDEQRTDALVDRFVETARLAPEAFPPSVVEYVFSMIEAGELWFYDPGLKALLILGEQPPRLARIAMLALAGGHALNAAGRILIKYASEVDPALIPSAAPALIELAAPGRRLIGSHPPPRPAALVRLEAAYPQAVASLLDQLLSSSAVDAGLAARALLTLFRRKPELSIEFARSLIATFVRARWMPDPDEYGHDPENMAAHDLETTIVAAFYQNPVQIDSLLREFRAGASETGHARIVSVYSKALRADKFRRQRSIQSADRLAMNRLLWEAPKTNNDNILRDIQRAIGSEPMDLLELAALEVDALLGAAILLDCRLAKDTSGAPPPNATFLDIMERNNHQQILRSLRGDFVAWAAAGAAAGAKPSAYLDVLANLPVTQDSFAACMIEHLADLSATAEELNAVLPTLYSALVGASVLRRGAALYALGKMPHHQMRNIPDLLYEAFLATLADPYIYVHRAAVMTLDHLSWPDHYKSRLRDGVWHILLAHQNDTEREDIVGQCIESLVPLLDDRQLSGRIGAFLVRVLSKMSFLGSERRIRLLAQDLARANGIVELLITHLTSPEATEHSQDNNLEAIAMLPTAVILDHRCQLAAISITGEWHNHFCVLEVIEILGRCGAWTEAEEAATRILSSIPDNVRESLIRSTFELVRAAAGYEAALAIGNPARVTEMMIAWQAAKSSEESIKRAIAQRPDPFRDIRKTPASRRTSEASRASERRSFDSSSTDG